MNPITSEQLDKWEGLCQQRESDVRWLENQANDDAYTDRARTWDRLAKMTAEMAKAMPALIEEVRRLRAIGKRRAEELRMLRTMLGPDPDFEGEIRQDRMGTA